MAKESSWDVVALGAVAGVVDAAAHLDEAFVGGVLVAGEATVMLEVTPLGSARPKGL